MLSRAATQALQKLKARQAVMRDPGEGVAELEQRGLVRKRLLAVGSGYVLTDKGRAYR